MNSREFVEVSGEFVADCPVGAFFGWTIRFSTGQRFRGAVQDIVYLAGVRAQLIVQHYPLVRRFRLRRVPASLDDVACLAQLLGRA